MSFRNRINRFLYNENLYKYNPVNANILENITIISGMPRGGTTWLMELLYQPKEQMVLWEPFHCVNLEEYDKSFLYEIGYLPYISENEVYTKGKEYFNNLFSGKIKSYNLLKTHPQINKNRNSKTKLLIKFCRLNMTLPWLVQNFNVKPIFLIRHPLAVISSQYHHKAFDLVGSKHDLFNLVGKFFNTLPGEYIQHIEKIDSKESFYANWWAIDNVVSLSHKYNNKKWLTLSYENLLLNSDYEIKRLMELPSVNITNIEKLKTPSKTNVNFELDQSKQLNKWGKTFSKQQITKMLDIIHSYGITAYNDTPIPDLTKIGY